MRGRKGSKQKTCNRWWRQRERWRKRERDGGRKKEEVSSGAEGGRNNMATVKRGGGREKKRKIRSDESYDIFSFSTTTREWWDGV